MRLVHATSVAFFREKTNATEVACTGNAAQRKAGGNAELVALPDVGIKGNSHMLMQDKNSLEVADWLLAWIAKIK